MTDERCLEGKRTMTDPAQRRLLTVDEYLASEAASDCRHEYQEKLFAYLQIPSLEAHRSLKFSCAFKNWNLLHVVV